jgi:hypothetical protein
LRKRVDVEGEGLIKVAESADHKTPDSNPEKGVPQPSASSQQDAAGSTPLAKQPQPQGGFWNLAKTVLDPDACKRVVNQVMMRTETRVKEQKPPEMKALTPIENYKMAAGCSASWDEMVGAGRVRFCKLCNNQVYDLSKLDKCEAEDLIFQREGKREVRLYMRKDGKFLTSNCPVGFARIQNMIVVVSIGAVVIVGLVCLLVFSPAPKQSAAVPVESNAVKTLPPLGRQARVLSATQVASSKPVTSQPQIPVGPMLRQQQPTSQYSPPGAPGQITAAPGLSLGPMQR